MKKSAAFSRLLITSTLALAAPSTAFAQAWDATTGGDGGRIIRVTAPVTDGPGSLQTVGAHPWVRSADEIRMLFAVAEGCGEVIDNEKVVGGYPHLAETRAPFVEKDWNPMTMTPKPDLYPGDHAGAQEMLSSRDKAMRETGARK
ncbi:hypothetical protein [Novosphingobium sp. BL-8H]|uniref:hypothetical protein n=1 Tax=Novosphingobium sp. BL-8H TaxID=3127640 RepID=UPI0037570D47